jgi:hypothetical protein
MDHQQAVLARGLQYGADRLDGGSEQRDVVAERGAEAARLEKIALHVDDDERGSPDIDLNGIWLGFDPDLHSIPRSPAGRATQVRGQVRFIVYSECGGSGF